MIDLEHWKKFSREDTCLDRMVPSDLRLLISEIERLRAALVKFGRHEPDCWQSNKDFGDPDETCNCGIGAALKVGSPIRESETRK